MKPIFSFGIMSDCQYADYPDLDDGLFDRRYRLAKSKLKDAVEFFDKHNLEFVVHLGDLIDQDAKSFETVMPICDSSKNEIWQVLGNHDFYGANYELIGNPKEVIKQLGMSEPYYSKIVKGYRFIILDTNEEGVIETRQGSPEYKRGLEIVNEYKEQGKVNAKEWNGRISQKQHEWLQNELIQADEKSQNVIIFSHHGLFPKHRENMLNDEPMLLELSKCKNLKAYINGHNHDGDYGQFQHLHCLTVKGMVDTGENSYAIARVYDNHIEIEGFGREPSRKLDFTTSGSINGAFTILKYKDKYIFQDRENKPDIAEPGLLSGFGGKTEKVDASFLENAKRELKEETDLPVDDLEFKRLGILNSDKPGLCEAYLVEITDNHFKVFEGKGYKQLTMDQIRSMDMSKFSITARQMIEHHLIS
ncbi:MAG TPA: metallophosphoesterase [Candidatus Saccharibacteria bacterium]|nr:metallophosphoesterase [Candidatus Saccharibacteria bacterium]